MKKTRRVDTKLQMHEVVIVHSTSLSNEPCLACLPEMGTLMTPEAAALIANTTVREVFRLIEAGAIHYRETSHGQVLVCINSLSGRASASVASRPHI